MFPASWAKVQRVRREGGRAIAMLAALAATFMAACGDNLPRSCPIDPQLPEQWTLDDNGIELVVQRAPYALTIRDGAGHTILQSLGAGSRDGYAALGWTRGQVTYAVDVSPGYTKFTPDLEPWRDDLQVASAQVVGGELRAQLTSNRDAAPGCITVVHTLRAAALRVEASTTAGAPPRAWSLAFASPGDEGFLGMGERINRTDQRGVDVYNWSEEGGIGAGEGKPLGPTNPFPHGEAMSYYPIPFFISTRGYGFWLDTTWRSEMNFATARADAWRAWEVGPTLAYEIYLPYANDATNLEPQTWPYELIDAFTARTGRPMRPPAWAFGPRRRIDRGNMQGGVTEIQAMRDNDLAITTVDDALHFFPAGDHVGNEDALRSWVASAGALGYQVDGYYNSMLATRADNPLAPLVASGESAGYFLARGDGTRPDVWVLTGGQMEHLDVVDFTNPDATAWYQSTFAWALDLGYAGWMYDFGEYVQHDVVANNGMSGEELHNLYPVLYAKAAFDALAPGRFWFMRSGYTGAAAYTPLVWGGDPAASFETADGLPSMVRAAINLGVSGVPHFAGDIGGFHCLVDGAQAADEELLTRWIEQGSMSSGMQDQDACVGGDQSAKATIWNSPQAQQAWRTYARLHTRLFPYFDALAAQASATGAPVVRHLFLEHPNHPELRAVDDAYYLGPALLVAPVITRGARSRTVTLPPGTFVDWDTRAVIAGGQTVTLDAPLGKLPLLLRAGYLVPLLDATIDTLADGGGAGVVGPGDVADVYDVVGVLAADTPTATFHLADGTVLSAQTDPAAITPGPVQVETAAQQTSTTNGITLRNGSSRRVRWDLVVTP